MEFDAVVVGSGIAGCVTAYYLAKANFSVCLVSKSDDIADSNTYYAQGGIVYKGKSDSFDLLYQDILNAGAGICNPVAARIVAEDGGSAVKDVLIKDFAVPFSKSGRFFDLTEEAAHSAKRILHVSDSTGKGIEVSAVKTLRSQKNITMPVAPVEDVSVEERRTGAKLFHALQLVAVGYLDETESMVGTWSASVRTQIDSKSAGAMPVLWSLHADGTAQYGSIPGDAREGQWRVLRRQGDKRIVRYEIRGQVGIQIFIFESPDQFKLISDVEENGKELVTLNELPMGGLVFHRIKE